MKVKEKTKMAGDSSGFYKLVKRFEDVERPPQWHPRVLFPGKTEEEVSKIVADFFNAISTEYQPITGNHPQESRE